MVVPVWLGDLDDNGQHIYWDCRVVLQSRASVSPGQSCEVRLIPLFPEAVPQPESLPQTFALWDGRHIAEGEITEILQAE
jgi:hypothetical protein